MAAPNGIHPATPPPSDQSAPTTTQPAPQNSHLEPSTTIETPLTSSTEDSTAKRPRDARLIHTVLASQGIFSYQQRVPLQLLDFAYRYTSGILSDSLRLSAEGYTAASGTTAGGKRGGGGGGGGAGAGGADDAGGTITLTALRQAIASRNQYTFQTTQPKDYMLAEAEQRNRVALPRAERGYGLQLPLEKYCLTGPNWSVKEEWESEEGEEEQPVGGAGGGGGGGAGEDETMGGMEGMEHEDEDEEGAGRMEDVFGESGDTTMAD